MRAESPPARERRLFSANPGPAGSARRLSPRTGRMWTPQEPAGTAVQQEMCGRPCPFLHTPGWAPRLPAAAAHEQ